MDQDDQGHFHDLRHAGTIWASKAGMSTSEADQKIADRLSKMVDEHRTGKNEDEEPDEDDEANPIG